MTYAKQCIRLEVISIRQVTLAQKLYKMWRNFGKRGRHSLPRALFERIHYVIRCITSPVIFLFAAVALALAPSPSQAGLIYVTPSGSSGVDGTVSGEADFSFGGGKVTVTLINTLKPDGSIVGAGQAISGLIFSVAPPPNPTPAATLQSVTGDVVDVLSKTNTVDLGIQTNPPASPSQWGLTSSTNNPLNIDIFTGKKPVYMILNNWDSTHNYPFANSSLALPGGHAVPGFRQSATFVINVPGVTSSSTVVDGSVTFQFGTSPGEVSVSGIPGGPPPPPPSVGAVPEPASIVLLGLGGIFGLGSLGLNRRRQNSIA
jgi:hypothetical protein